MNTRTKWLQGPHKRHLEQPHQQNIHRKKKEKMFWSNQPPLGLMTGNYYKNEGVFTGGNYGIVEIITEPETQRILNVEFTEFASDPYYDTRYSGVNKRLSDYPEFQASNTRTDDTLVTVVNGITYVEKQMRDENRVTGNFIRYAVHQLLRVKD